MTCQRYSQSLSLVFEITISLTDNAPQHYTDCGPNKLVVFFFSKILSFLKALRFLYPKMIRLYLFLAAWGYPFARAKFLRYSLNQTPTNFDKKENGGTLSSISNFVSKAYGDVVKQTVGFSQCSCQCCVSQRTENCVQPPSVGFQCGYNKPSGDASAQDVSV